MATKTLTDMQAMQRARITYTSRYGASTMPLSVSVRTVDGVPVIRVYDPETAMFAHYAYKGRTRLLCTQRGGVQ